MKIKNILLAGTLLVSVLASAQKDELKTLKKIYTKDKPSASDVTDYKSAVGKLQGLATENEDKIYLDFYKSVLPMVEVSAMDKMPGIAQLQKMYSPQAIPQIASATKAVLDYEKKTGKKILTDNITEDIAVEASVFTEVAVQLSKAQKDAEAAEIMYAVYQLDPKRQDNLFYAASLAVNGKQFDKALQYYRELKTLNYTGEGTLYYAYNKGNKVDEYFLTNEQRANFIKLGTHEKPHDEKVPSKKGEIYKNIALILVDQGKTEEAKQAFADAKTVDPNDTTLLLTEANLYLKSNDIPNYTRLVNEALQKEPNNADLVYNLGVVSADANKLDVAESYYKKAIEIDPNFFNAYLNLAELKMRNDKKFVDEINKLGTSDKELKRYEVLKGERNKNFASVLPLLEKAVELKPDNEDAKRTLLSIYNAMEMTEKYKALKAKM